VQGRVRELGVAAVALGIAAPRRILAAACCLRSAVGREHGHQGRDRHPGSRSAAPRRPSGPEPARGQDRDLGGRQRHDQGARPDRSRGDLMGRGLPAAGPAETWLHRRRPSCAKAQICPAISLTDFFNGGTASTAAAGSTGAPPGTQQAAPTREDIRSLLQALPCFISQVVISHRGNAGQVARRRSVTPRTSPSGSGCSRSRTSRR